MAKMCVTLLRYNTQAKQADSISARKQAIEFALQDSQDLVESLLSAEDKKRRVWSIFAAPEYMFANPLQHADHVAGDVRHISEATKIEIEAWLETLSLKYPHCLIFPGSIAWKKSLQRENLKDYYLKQQMLRRTVIQSTNEVAAKWEKKQQGPTRHQKAAAEIKTNMQVFVGGRKTKLSGDIYEFTIREPGSTSNTLWYLANPGYGKKSWYGAMWTDEPKNAQLKHAALTPGQKLAELGGAGNLTHMARNTCLVYLTGERILKYNKAQDYHEVLDTNGDTVYVPGQTEAHFFVDGKMFGLEICLDHVFGTLIQKTQKAWKQSHRIPQIVVVMSAMVHLDTNKLPPNAMVIHACSQWSHSLVGRRGAKGADAKSERTTGNYSVFSFDPTTV